MVLPFLKRPEAEVGLTPSATMLCPGDRLEVEASLTPRESFQVRGGTVELACVETYWKKRHSRHGTTYYTVAEELLKLSERFIEERSVISGVPYRGRVAFTIPAGAVPTVRGKLASVAWRLKVSVDVVGARDVSEEREVVVLAKGQARAEEARSQPGVYRLPQADASYRQCDLYLALVSPVARVGDSVSGTLRAVARRNASFWEVRVELRRREKAGAKSDTVLDDQQSFGRDIVMRAGESREWPFILRVPQDYLPTTQLRQTELTWKVRGVFARRFRTDFPVERALQVYTVEASQGGS